MSRWIAVPMLVLSLGTSLLPAGWVLCVAPDGHLVFELAPVAGSDCCEPQGDARAAEACAPESCDSCQDVALGQGAAISSRSSARWLHSSSLPCVTLAALVVSPAAEASSAVSRTARTDSSSPSRSTILRC